MVSPTNYEAAKLQEELDKLQEQLNRLSRQLILIPLASPPVNPKEGTVANSDGTGGGFDTSSGAGLYRYASGSWHFVG